MCVNLAIAWVYLGPHPVWSSWVTPSNVPCLLPRVSLCIWEHIMWQVTSQVSKPDRNTTFFVESLDVLEKASQKTHQRYKKHQETSRNIKKHQEIPPRQSNTMALRDHGTSWDPPVSGAPGLWFHSISVEWPRRIGAGPWAMVGPGWGSVDGKIIGWCSFWIRDESWSLNESYWSYRPFLEDVPKLGINPNLKR